MTKASTVNNQTMTKIRNAEDGFGLTLTRKEGMSLLSVSFLCGFFRPVPNREVQTSRPENIEDLLRLKDEELRHKRMRALTNAIISEAAGSLHFLKKCTISEDFVCEGRDFIGVAAESSKLEISQSDIVLLPVEDLSINPLNMKKQTKIGLTYQDYPELLLTRIIYKSLKPGELIVMRRCRDLASTSAGNNKEAAFALTGKIELISRNRRLTVESLEESFSALKNLAHTFAGMGFLKMESSTGLQLLKLRIIESHIQSDETFDPNANWHVQVQTLLLFLAFRGSGCNLLMHTEGDRKLVREIRDFIDAVARNPRIIKPTHWIIQALSTIERKRGNEFSGRLFKVLSSIEKKFK